MLSNVKYELKDRIAYIILNRPEKRNALNAQMVEELKICLDKATEDKKCKVIILKSNAEVFCAGADLAYLQQLQNFSYDENLADSLSLMALFKKIHDCPKVIISCIEGHALAGGCGIATLCDFSFSIPEAKFGYTEVKIGFIPAIVMVFLIRKIGEGKARELLLSGKVIEAVEAQKMGLINYVIEKDQIESEVLKFATQLVNETSGQSIMLVKEMMAEVQNLSLESGLRYAAEMNAKARGSEDCKKGIKSFLDKSKLSW